MPIFTVQQGKRYRAAIALSGLERWASNDMIAGRLREAGFAEVQVWGEGGDRQAEALWPGADRTGELPAQVQAVAEITTA